MGKKRIIKQTEEELTREGTELELRLEKERSRAIGPPGLTVKSGIAHILATYNNTLITVTDGEGRVLAWSSAGTIGFKGTKKATPFAAARVAEAVAEKIKKMGLSELMVVVKGVGSGRESAIRSLANRGFTINLIRDETPIPHNGPRPKKVRRV